MKNIAELNNRFGLDERLVFEQGPNNLVRAQLRDAQGHQLEAYLQGATVASWKTPRGEDILFISSKAEYKEGKALRGGIPLVFPQFGPGKLPSHGFARVHAWQVVASSMQEEGATEITLQMQANDQTRALWPYDFELRYEISLSSVLRTTFLVKNTGRESFAFENAFHTYFTIGDITKVRLPYLQGLTYLDNTKSRERVLESNNEVAFAAEVDRVYLNAPNELNITEPPAKRKIAIKKDALSDAVVWNPWIEKSKTLSDLGAEDYKKFVCVETGNIGTKVTLEPSKEWSCAQEISYLL